MKGEERREREGGEDRILIFLRKRRVYIRLGGLAASGSLNKPKCENKVIFA